MSSHSHGYIDQAEIFNGVRIKHLEERIDGNNAAMVSADGKPADIPENQSRTGRVKSTANETLIFGKAACDSPSLQASTKNKTQAHSDATALAVIKSHHGKDQHDDGNILFLNESKSAGGVMEVLDDKNTKTVVRAATKHPILMLHGKGNTSSFCNDNSGENADGNEDQHTQKDVPFEEKKLSKQFESYTVIDEESSASAFCVSSQCIPKVRDLKKMLYYSRSISGKQDNFGSASFTENEAERNEKSKSCEHVSGEKTDDAVNAVHGVGISDAKKVRFDVPATSDCDHGNNVTNPKSRINHTGGTSNERTDALLKQKKKEKYHTLVVEEVNPYRETYEFYYH